MGKKGYVFSLDAFVAFSLVLISVQAMLAMASAPAGYYHQLQQASYLAHDTLDVMKIAKIACQSSACPTYLEMMQAYSYSTNACQANPGCFSNITQLNDNNIPPQYSYAYIYDDLKGSSIMLFNASNFPGSSHYGVKYRRIMASAQTYVLGYSPLLQRGDSPYCNVVCHGFVASTGTYKQPGDCSDVPCGSQIDPTFRPGTFKVGLLRMVVWG